MCENRDCTDAGMFFLCLYKCLRVVEGGTGFLVLTRGWVESGQMMGGMVLVIPVLTYTIYDSLFQHKNSQLCDYLIPSENMHAVQLISVRGY